MHTKHICTNCWWHRQHAIPRIDTDYYNGFTEEKLAHKKKKKKKFFASTSQLFNYQNIEEQFTCRIGFSTAKGSTAPLWAVYLNVITYLNSSKQQQETWILLHRIAS